MTQNPFLLDLRIIQHTALDNALNDATIESVLSEAVQHLKDLECCIDQIKHRKEFYVFDLAIRELNQSLLLALNSHYRQSFTGQRLALELWFSAVDFSVNEFSFKKWKLNEKDISWSKLINKDDGILSAEFSHVFWPSTTERVSSYRNMAEKIYRECSQYVHGNNDTHDFLPKTFGYSKEAILCWKNNLDTVVLLFLYTFLLRFNEELDSNSINKLSIILNDNLGHISEVRDLLSQGGVI